MFGSKGRERKLNVKLKQLCKDTLLICAGLFVMALGSAMSYHANLGTGSIGTIVDGTHRLLGISRGMADITVSVILLVIVFFRERDLINIGTVISLFFTGLSIDFWKEVLTLLPQPPVVGPNIYFVLGLIFGAMGTGFYVAVNTGTSAYDAYILTIYRATKWQYRNAKILGDGILMVLGICLGGTIGIGTIVSTVAGGYLTQFFIKRSTKLLKRKAILNN